MANSIPTAALLNGWDYVLAVTEEQVNKGLRMAYEGRNVGTAFPKFPTGHHTLPLGSDGAQQLNVTLGCPRITATLDAAKQCELSIPLLDAKILGPGTPTVLPNEALLVVTASLSCTQTSVEAEENPGSATRIRHMAFIDFKDRLAIYRVHLGQAGPARVSEHLEIALEQLLRGFHEHAFRLASFDVPAQENPYVPRVVEASFVRDAGAPGRNALVFAASLDREGAHRDNRRAFEAGILPVDVPAALWVSPRVVLERLTMPMLREALKNGDNRPNLHFDETKGEIVLTTRYALPQSKGHDTVLEGLSVYGAYAGAGWMVMHTDIRIYNIEKWKDAYSHVWGHIQFGLDAERSRLVATHNIDSSSTDVENHTPWWAYLITLGGIAIYNLIFGLVAEHDVSAITATTLSEKLGVAAQAINGIMTRIPAMENLTAGGHLVFERVAFIEGGAAFLGIRATGAATTPTA